MSKYVLLWLEAPLQSWGFNSRFGRRETCDFPTKSGLIGLVCCAMGAGGAQTELLAEFRGLDLCVNAYEKEKKTGRDTPGQLEDFQMVGSGYDDSDKWQNLMIPKKDDGKKPVGSGVKLTYRYYLQDKAFAAALEVPQSRAEEIAAALVNPVWSIYLGRKCCVPTEQVFQGAYSTQQEALSYAEKLAKKKELSRIFTVKDGEFEDEGEIFSLSDVPLSFGETKRYESRYVTVIRNAAGSENEQDLS